MKRISILLPLFYVSTSAYADINLQQTDNSPITVHAKRLSVHKKLDGPQTTINQKKIQSSGFTNLKQVLQQSGGLQITDITSNGSQSSINMRGFGANADTNSLVLINGIPLTNPDLAPPNLNIIPLNDISRVEIIEGSESVRYGDQAVGGVINIVTNDAEDESGHIACRSGSYNQYGCDGTYNNSLQQLRYHISAAANHADNYRDQNNYDLQTVGLGLNYPYETGNLQTNINILNENMQYPGPLTAAQVRQNRRQASNDTDYFKDMNGSIQLLEHHVLNDNWTLETAIARRQMSGQGVLTSAFNQSRNSNYIKPTIKGQIYNTTITAGADWQNDNYHLGSLYGVTEDDQNKYGAFSLASIPWHEQTTFTLGVRGAGQSSKLESYTTNTNLNRAFASTAGVSYQLSPNTSWYLRRAESFRFPKADENAFTTPGSTGLRTQRGVSYESGIHFERDTDAYNVNIYQLDLKDEIAYDPLQTPQTPFGSNQNLAPTQRQGLTFAGNKHFTQTIAVDAQYNLVAATFRNGIYANKHIPLVAENILHTGAQYDITDNWHLYVEAVYTGSQYAANDYANVTGQLGGYTTYGFNIRYTRKTLSATLRADNIFNKYYYFYSVYQTGMDTTFFYPAPTRNVMLTVTYEMG